MSLSKTKSRVVDLATENKKLACYLRGLRGLRGLSGLSGLKVVVCLPLTNQVT